MNTLLNELNKFAFIIAPIFYMLLFMSLSALCIGAFIILLRHFADNKISPTWKYSLWTFVLIALIIPCRFPSEFALLKNIEKVQEISYRNEYDLIKSKMKQHMFIENNKLTPHLQSELRKIKKDWKALYLKSLLFDVIIPFIWLFGVFFILIFMLITHIRLLIMLHQDRYETNHRHYILLQKCKTKLNIKANIELISHNYICSPALLGLFKPKIIIPSFINDMSNENIEYILLHELSHYKRFDMLLNYLLLLLQAIYWFNPLVWNMFKSIRQDIEIANDAYVLKYIGSHKSNEYIQSLIEVLKEYNNISFAPKLFCMVDGKNHMERRIKMIQRSKEFKKHRIVIHIIGLIVIFFISTFFLTKTKITDTNPLPKLQAFKGLELYIWKNEVTTGNDDTYFNLLYGTNRNKEYSEIYDINSSTTDINVIGEYLRQYEDGLHLHIYHMNETDFTKEQINKFYDELIEYLPKNHSVSMGKAIITH